MKATTRPEFFQWTVEAHNFVNRALKKPEFSINEALNHYPEQWLPPNELWLHPKEL